MPIFEYLSAHRCPECGEPCRCLSGDIVERACTCCDYLFDDDDESDSDYEEWVFLQEDDED